MSEIKDEKYSNGKIYKIVCNVTGMVYIGSTIKTTDQRLHRHRAAYTRYKKVSRPYMSSFEILKQADYRIELIEEFPCDNRIELCKREIVFITEMNCVNSMMPYIDPIDKTERRRTQSKKHYLKNRSRLSEVIYCECGRTYTKSHRTRHNKTQHHQKCIETKDLYTWH